MANKGSLFDRIAKLYSKRNKARDAFAKIDDKSKRGVVDHEKFNKWNLKAQELEKAERELLDEKLAQYENQGFKYSRKISPVGPQFNRNLSPRETYSDLNSKYGMNFYDEHPELGDWLHDAWANAKNKEKKIKSMEAALQLDRAYKNGHMMRNNFGPGDIQFMDKNGVRHDPSDRHYNLRGAPYTDEPIKPYTNEEYADMLHL